MFNLFKRKIPAAPSEAEQLVAWEQAGRPYPPPHVVKQKAIAAYAQRYQLQTLVETGTYLGDMVEAQKNNFRLIYSIELSEKLHRKAVRRFSADDHIKLLRGDSGVKLKEVVQSLSAPALFWLDGHYSGGITALGDKECPVREELAAIFTSKPAHIILIDDARLFNGTQDYPTMEELQSIISNHHKNYQAETMDDIIRLTPNV